jgi:hypothetical protein
MAGTEISCPHHWKIGKLTSYFGAFKVEILFDLLQNFLHSWWCFSYMCSLGQCSFCSTNICHWYTRISWSLLIPVCSLLCSLQCWSICKKIETSQLLQTNNHLLVIWSCQSIAERITFSRGARMYRTVVVAVGKLPTVVMDGRSLNPIVQKWLVGILCFAITS